MKRVRRDEDDKEEGTAGKMLHNLDMRLRNIEGKVPTYFLTGENIFSKALLNANKIYDDQKPARGQPHQLGPRRTTLAGSFLLTLSTANLKEAQAKERELIKFFDTIAQAVGNPTIEAQQTLLASLVAHYTTPKLLEPEIASCQFFKTKRAEKFIFMLEFQPHSPLRHCYEFVRVGLSTAGATLADGPPPRGPIIRDISRK